MRALNAVLAIASRDVLKLLRDRGRLVFSVVGPFLFVGLMGGTLQANLGDRVGFNYVEFIFTGILGMTVFQSAAQGVVSLIDDRVSDFAQEMFIAPIPRYTIVLGKVVGETLVAALQVVPLLAFAIAVRLISPGLALPLLAAALAGGLLGGTFGVAALGALSSNRSANQLFGFIVFPQFFLSGVFNPVVTLPWYLEIFSLASPMRYPVDLVRGLAFGDNPAVVLMPPAVDLAVIAALFAAFLAIGTFLFVRAAVKR